MRRINKLIVVLGMHRSGTSAIARALTCLGADLGTNLHPGIPEDNAKGFWEDLGVVQLNEELLYRIGFAWDVIDAIPEPALQSCDIEDIRRQARSLLESKTKDSRILGLKDPRISKLIPFWSQIFEDLQLEVSYVICLRNPLSVADSLRRRNGFLPAKSYRLWLSYMASCMVNCGPRSFVVDYDEMMKAPRQELMRMFRLLRLRSACPKDRVVEEYCDEFLDVKLQHNKHSLDQLDTDIAMPQSVRNAYLALRSASRESAFLLDECKHAFLPYLDQLRANDDRLGEIVALRQDVLQQKVEIERTKAKLIEVSDWGDKLSYECKQRDATISELQTRNLDAADFAAKLSIDVAERDERIRTLSAKNLEVSDWATTLARVVEERDVQVLELSGKLSEFSTEFDNISKGLADRDARILALNHKLAELSAWSTKLSYDLKDRDALVLDLGKKNAELSSWGSKLTEEVAERDARILALNAAVAELTTWSQKLATDLGDRDSRVLELSRSNESLSKWAETQGRDIALRDSQVTDLTRKVDELSSWGTQQSVVLKERDAKIDDLSRKSNELADRIKDLSTSLANKNVQLEALNLTIGDLVRREKELELHMLDGTARIDELLRVIADAESSREALRVQLGMKDHLIDTLRNDAAETKLTLAAKHAELMKMSDWAQGIHKELKAIKARPHMKLVGHARNAGAAVRNTISSSFVGDLVRHVRDSKRYRKHMVSFEALRTSLAKCDGRLLVTFPIITWDFRWQRPQHIVSRLRDNGYSVVYLAMSLTPLQRRFRSYREAGAALQFNALATDVSQIWLHSRQPVNVYVDPLVGDDLANIVDGMVALLNELKPDSITYLIQFPGWWPVAAALKEKFGGSVVFDCMDDHGGFSTNTADALKTESHLIKAADLVVTSSALLQERCSKENVNTIQIKNGTEFEHFADPKPNGLLDHLAAFPVIGYYGAISDWFDMELVAYCARMRPNWNFVLIGATFGSDLKSVETLPNVHFLGEKPYKDLPGFLAYFDVCTIPFKIIPLTLATNPVKFYEYLSAGKPVVSVKLPELVPYAENCYLAATPDEFLAQLELALAERDDKEKISRRLDLARENSWDSRVKLLLKSAMFSQKKSD